MSSGGLDRPQIGQVLHETYTLERVIGQGGVGVVYEASHRRLSRRFAVKVLQPAAAAETEGLERFRREAEVTSKLGHPNIIEIVDFNITPHGDSYLVMELLRGESLQTRLDRVGALALEQVASILKQIASALQAAHDQGIIHRDLKPENIFLCQLPDRDDHVKVLDFGMSKMVGLPRLTRTNTILGTPFYMSPEQAEGRSVATDVGADQFSLGVMLYTMLCGRVPFAGGTVDEVLRQVAHDDPPPMQNVPPGVERAVARAMAKRTADRFPSVSQLSIAFHQAWRGDSAPEQGEELEALRTEPEGLPALELMRTELATSSKQDDLGVTEPALGVTEPPAIAIPAAVTGASTRPYAAGVELDPPPPRRRVWFVAAVVGVAIAAVAALVLWPRGPVPPQPSRAGGDLGSTVSTPADSAADQASRSDSTLAPDSRAPDSAVVPDARSRTRPGHRATKQPRPEPVPPSVSAPGHLRVATTAGGKPLRMTKIYIDGELKGLTPRRFTMPAGRYKLELVHAGYRSVVRQVTVQGDQTTPVIVELTTRGSE